MSYQDQQNEATEEQLKPYYDKVYLQADSISRYFMIGFFVVGILLSFFYDTFLLAVIMGGSSLAIYFLIQTFMPESQFLRYATSFLFWNFGLQFLFQMQGLSEMHFVFFIALTVLLFYEDWKLLLPATIYAMLTLIVFYFYNDDPFFKTYLPATQNITAISFILHLSLLLIYALLCLRWSMMQRDQTHESAIRAILMERQLTMMNTNIMFADSISQGNLNVDYPSSQTDKLGQSLLNMRSSLAEATKREERERFSTSGLAKIGDLLRQHANSLELLCDHVIEEIVKYMKANQGAIFMLEEKDNANVHLKLMACRAWDRKKFLQKNVNLGEGLIGQAAVEKQTIYLTKVPNNYISISSGLGEANPKCVLIVPLKMEDEIVGVIELASFQTFLDYEIEFLEKVGTSIAATMITTQNNQRTKILLEQSHALTEQMRSQEEEIRQNMEEMQASQEEMMRKEKEINRLLEESRRNEQLIKDKMEEVKRIEEADKQKTEKMLKELEHNRKITNQVIEELPEKIFLKDEDGRLLMLNSALAAGYNKPVEALLGTNDFDNFPKELASIYRAAEEEIISSGKPLAMTEDFPDANGEIRNLYTMKMPFHFPDSKKVGILGYQVDITEIKRMEKKVKESEINMQKKEEEALIFMKDYQRTLLDILDQLPHKIFLKDENGRMVLANTVVAKAHGMSIEELIGKNDFDFVDAKTAQEWRNQELEIIKKESETSILDENQNGEERTLKNTKMAFFIRHLNQTGLLSIQTDITELQNLKAQLESRKGK